MQPNPKYTQLPSDEVVQKTAQALEQNGITVTCDFGQTEFGILIVRKRVSDVSPH